MKVYVLKTITRAGVGLALIGGIYALLASLIWPEIIWNMVIAMMLIAGGSGLSSPIFNRLAIEASDEPMGARIAMSSCLMGVFGMLGSAIISSVYNGTLFSLGLILFIFNVISIFLEFINKGHPNENK